MFDIRHSAMIALGIYSIDLTFGLLQVLKG